MGKDIKNKPDIDIDKLRLYNELSQKISIGLKLAWRKLVIKSAANNQSLVIKVNGEIKTVPAKELLKDLEL